MSEESKVTSLEVHTDEIGRYVVVEDERCYVSVHPKLGESDDYPDWADWLFAGLSLIVAAVIILLVTL